MANGMISTFLLQVSLLDALRDYKPAGGNRLEHTAYVLRRGLVTQTTEHVMVYRQALRQRSYHHQLTSARS